MTRRRVFCLVIDSLGAGAMPDAADFRDPDTVNTIGNIDRTVDSFHLPNMEKMGLGHITPMRHVKAIASPTGYYGRLAELSQGKDTTTGHWEMMGMVLDKAFQTFPDGFPPEIVERFIAESGCKGVLGNKSASGTVIIEEFGAEHLETGYPILYTSADSVFQLATHVDKVPLQTLYKWCEDARRILTGPYEVSRVIARPFTGQVGAFERLGGDRHDYVIEPPQASALDRVVQAGGVVFGVGKIKDIFCGKGITHAQYTRDNTHGLVITGQAIREEIDLAALSVDNQPLSAFNLDKQFIFVNLVDTDMKFGHRRDPIGYAGALEEIDRALGEFIPQMQPGDLLMLTGDHGCDPTAPGTDHTREYIPILMYSPDLEGKVDLKIGQTFANIGQTVLDWLQLDGQGLPGTSMLKSTLEPTPA